MFKQIFNFKKPQIFAYLASLLTLGTVLSIVGLIDHAERERFQQENRTDVLNQLSTTRAKLEKGLNKRLFLTRGVVAHISTINPDITQEEFANLAAVMLAQTPGVKSIALYKGSVFSHMHPIKGFESVIGFDPRTIPEEKEAIDRAINSRKTVLAGPVNLKPKGVAFIARTPVFLTPKGQLPESGNYWGLVGIIIEQELLFDEAGLLDKSSNLKYVMRGKDGLGEKGAVFFGDGEIFKQNPVISEIILPNGSWQIAAMPKTGWLMAPPISKWLWIGGTLLSILAGSLMFILVIIPAKLKSENLRLSAELDVTRRMQKMLVPADYELQQINDLELAGFMDPALEVGGDYYDVLEYDGRLKIAIGDVTGHGLESGVLMIMLQTAIRTLLVNGETDYKNFLDVVNRTIYQNLIRMKCDKSMSLLIADYVNGSFYISGQHEQVIIVRNDGKLEEIDTMDLGFPIGLDADISDFISAQKVELNCGDMMVLYTDGITEAENINKELYGLARLMDLVQKNHHKSAQEIRQTVIDDVINYIGKQTVFDDITLLVIKKK